MTHVKSGITLIVGGTGLIGRALKAHLNAQGRAVLATSRRNTNDAQMLPLDLSADMAAWSVPAGVQRAVICAGIGDMGLCEKDPVSTARVNVDGTYALVRKLTDAGVFVVCLSTSQVFDGKAALVAWDAPYAPLSAYGRQRAELERKILALGKPLAIVRLTKVLDTENKLLQSWKKNFEAGIEVTPFSDVYFSPVSVGCVVRALQKIADEERAGIFQVSASDEMSYAEAALFYAERLGRREARVCPNSVDSVSALCNILPRHGSLNSTRVEAELGIRMESSKAVIQALASGNV